MGRSNFILCKRDVERGREREREREEERERERERESIHVHMALSYSIKTKSYPGSLPSGHMLTRSCVSWNQ